MKQNHSFNDIPIGISETMAQIELSKEPVIVMGIGVASCRSAVMDDLAWRLGPHINAVSLDTIYERLLLLHAGKSIVELQEIQVHRQVKHSLEDHRIAVVDGIYSEFRDRVKDIKKFREIGAVTIGALFIHTDPSEVIQKDEKLTIPPRHLEVVRLEPDQPAIQEGFDWIVTVVGTDVSTITTGLPK